MAGQDSAHDDLVHGPSNAGTSSVRCHECDGPAGTSRPRTTTPSGVAPEPLLARFERADQRMRPSRRSCARWRGARVSCRNSRRARTPRHIRRCTQRPPATAGTRDSRRRLVRRRRSCSSASTWSWLRWYCRGDPWRLGGAGSHRRTPQARRRPAVDCRLAVCRASAPDNAFLSRREVLLLRPWLDTACV